MAGIELDGANQKVVLDSDGDTYLEAATDDTIKVYVAGAHDATISANAINVLSGTTLTIDSGATIANSGTATGFGGNVPSSADGQALGSASAEWSDLFLADGGIIKFGNDQDITLTHVADTGLTLNGTFTAANAVLINGTTPTLTIGDAGAEDTKIVFDGNAQDFYIGLDDSADDLVIGLGSALGTTTHMAFDETGAVIKPLQPAFSATTNATQTNLTEDADNTIVFGLEIFDVNGDFASNTFTAPVAGKYMLTAKIVAAQIDHDGAYYAQFQIVTSNRDYSVNYSVRDFFEAQPELWTYQVAVVADMDASDTAFVRYRESGPGASQTDVYNANSVGAQEQHQFNGYLLG